MNRASTHFLFLLLTFFTKAYMNTIALIPAAGFGTRFLPFTKTVPKELVPLNGIPALEYILRESHASGIDNICIITNTYKQGLIDYCKSSEVVDAFLNQVRKTELLHSHYEILNQLTINFTFQQEAKGLGHAIAQAQEQAQAKDLIAVLLPDDIMSSHDCLKDMINLATLHKASIIAVQKVPQEKTSSYGIVGFSKQQDNELLFINTIIEKPHPEQAPSNYAVIGRYVFQPVIFDMLKKINPGKNGEYQLTDAIALLLQNNYPVLAYVYTGTRFDVGNPQGFLEANNYFTLKQNID